MWFLLECREEDNIHSQYPYVRIAKRSEKFSESVSLNTETYGDFTDALEKAKDFPPSGPILVITDGYIEDHLKIRREHAFLIPNGNRLPFRPKGKVFYMENKEPKESY